MRWDVFDQVNSKVCFQLSQEVRGGFVGGDLLLLLALWLYLQNILYFYIVTKAVTTVFLDDLQFHSFFRLGSQSDKDKKQVGGASSVCLR